MKHYSRGMLQVFSLELAKIPMDGGSVELYGYVAIRDDLDPLLNYVVNISRDYPITVQQVHIHTHLQLLKKKVYPNTPSYHFFCLTPLAIKPGVCSLMYPLLSKSHLEVVLKEVCLCRSLGGRCHVGKTSMNNHLDTRFRWSLTFQGSNIPNHRYAFLTILFDM
jgi:hypothetical protein